MKNVLITGGAGYIGSQTNKNLSLAGYSTVVFDNLSRGNLTSIGGIPPRKLLEGI